MAEDKHTSEGTSARSSSEEQESLVTEGSFIDRDALLHARKQRLWRRIFCIAGVQLVLILLYTIIAGVVIWKHPFGFRAVHMPTCDAGQGVDLVYSPARKAAKYEAVLLHNPIDDTNVFKGEPRPELDAAWHDILKHQSIRVEKSDLEKINRTSVPLSDGGGGYLAVLDVFHELHCLNYIREFVHRDYYESRESVPMQRKHVDHCIDTIRQVLMCHADISFHTYDWIENYRWPYPNFAVEHECRNWDSIMEWTKKRSLLSLRGNVLMHPDLGPSWPEGDDEDEDDF